MPADNTASTRVAAEIRALREARGLTTQELAALINEMAPKVLTPKELSTRQKKNAAWITAIEDGSADIYIGDILEFAGAFGITEIELLKRAMSRAESKSEPEGSSKCAR